MLLLLLKGWSKIFNFVFVLLLLLLKGSKFSLGIVITIIIIIIIIVIRIISPANDCLAGLQLRRVVLQRVLRLL